VDGRDFELPDIPEEHQLVTNLQTPLNFPLVANSENFDKKKVKLFLKQGKDLMPLDKHGLSKPNSDPYFKLFWKDKLLITEVVNKSLNPEFSSKEFEIGEISADDNSVLEVQYWDHDRITFDDFGGCALICVAGMIDKLNGQSGDLVEFYICRQYPLAGQIWVDLKPSDAQMRERKKVTGQFLLDVVVE